MPKDFKLHFCEICRSSFLHENRLRTHMKTKHKQEVPKLPKDPTRFYCEICSNSYKLKQTLKDHMKRYHPQENTLQESFQPTVPAIMPNIPQNDKISQFLKKIAYNQSLDKNPNTGVIMPNILQNSQNDNIAQPVQKIAHNPASDTLPYISLNS